MDKVSPGPPLQAMGGAGKAVAFEVVSSTLKKVSSPGFVSLELEASRKEKGAGSLGVKVTGGSPAAIQSTAAVRSAAWGGACTRTPHSGCPLILSRRASQL